MVKGITFPIQIDSAAFPLPSQAYHQNNLPRTVSVDDYDLRIKVSDNPDGLKRYLNVNLTRQPTQPSQYSPYRQVNLTMLNKTHFNISIGNMRSYSTDEDEVLDIKLTPTYFWHTRCRPTTSQLFVEITIVATPDAVAKATQAAAAVVTTAAVSSSMAAGGAAAAGDAQSLALLAMMSCAQPVEKKMTKNTRLLAPLAVSDTLEGIVLGNIILVFLILFLQLSALIIGKNVLKKKWLEAAEFVQHVLQSSSSSLF